MSDLQEQEEISLAIKVFRGATKTICKVCDRELTTKIPLQITLDYSREAVCDECARRYAPELSNIVQIRE